MNLRQLAIQVSISIGLVHQQNLKVLRDYIREHTIEDLAKEITTINESLAMRAIWEAGVPKGLQPAFLQRMNEIK